MQYSISVWIRYSNSCLHEAHKMKPSLSGLPKLELSCLLFWSVCPSLLVCGLCVMQCAAVHATDSLHSNCCINKAFIPPLWAMFYLCQWSLTGPQVLEQSVETGCGHRQQLPLSASAPLTPSMQSLKPSLHVQHYHSFACLQVAM